MSNTKEFIKGIIGGICIGLGGTVFLSIENKVAGSIFFGIGLLMICTFGFNLFTGKVCYVLDNDKKYIKSLPVIWIGNLIGSFLMAYLERMTKLAPFLSEKASAIVEAKLSDSFLSLFILGIFCNILIYFGVEGYKTTPYEFGKIMCLLFAVSVFVLCGFEHSIATMFYVSVAGMWSIKSLIVVIIITFGNCVGGILIPLLKRLYWK